MINVSEYTDLAREIQLSTGADDETAYRLAWQMMPELLDLVMRDVRFQPARVVVFDLLSAKELAQLTDR